MDGHAVAIQMGSISSSSDKLPTPDSLEFKDIAHTTSSGAKSPTPPSLREAEPILLDDDRSSLLPEDSRASASVFSLPYYQRFFDVTTAQIGKRLMRPFIVHRDFFTQDDPRPDLYGPFWLANTLIILLAASSTFSDWYAFSRDSANNDKVWKYDFQRVTVAASTFYLFISVFPLLVWAVAQRVAASQKTLVEFMCIYGYSLIPLVPILGGLVVGISWLSWLLCAVALCVSVVFLLRNLFPMPPSKAFYPPVGLAVALHSGLFLLVRLYFF